MRSLAAWPALAADEKKDPGEKPAKEKAAKEKAAAEKPAEAADPFAVPEGTPKELVEFIKKLMPTLAQGDDETKAKARQAILKAAEKILAAKPATRKWSSPSRRR